MELFYPGGRRKPLLACNAQINPTLWGFLHHNLERAEGNPVAAAAARAKAIDLFRQWRRGGAENHSRDAKLAAFAFAYLSQGDTAELVTYLVQEVASDPEYMFDRISSPSSKAAATAAC